MQVQFQAISTLLDQGATDAAIRMIRSMWQPDISEHDRATLFCLWIRGLCESGELDHAKTLAQRAAQDHPDDPSVLSACATVMDLRGDWEKAHALFSRSLELCPGHPMLQYNLGGVLEKLGRQQEAAEYYQKIIDSDRPEAPLVEATSALGNLYRKQGHPEVAGELYEHYLQDDPLHPSIQVEYGICLSELGDNEEALNCFRAALSLDNKQCDAWFNQAITHYRLGQTIEAKRSMKRALDLDPKNPLTLALLGSWQLADGDEGDLDNALHMLYRSLDHVTEMSLRNETADGEASLVVEEIFEALWVHGRPNEARELARIAGRRDWITPYIFDTLNRHDHGEVEQAETFQVSARAKRAADQANEQPAKTSADIKSQLSEENWPEGDSDRWPEGVEGYTTKLTVAADNEETARSLALEYLKNLDPRIPLRFDIKVQPFEVSEAEPSPQASAPSDESEGSSVSTKRNPNKESDEQDTSHVAPPRAHGVMRVNSNRHYF